MPTKEESGDWLEYRRLVISELQGLNARMERHHDVLKDIDKTLLRQAVQLDDHMARTETAEKRIEMLQTQIDPLVKAGWISSFFLKVSAGLAAAVATALGVIELLKVAGKIK